MNIKPYTGPPERGKSAAPNYETVLVITRIQVSFTWEDLKLTRTVQCGGTEIVGSERAVRYDRMLHTVDQSRAVC